MSRGEAGEFLRGASHRFTERTGGEPFLSRREAGREEGARATGRKCRPLVGGEAKGAGRLLARTGRTMGEPAPQRGPAASLRPPRYAHSSTMQPLTLPLLRQRCKDTLYEGCRKWQQQQPKPADAMRGGGAGQSSSSAAQNTAPRVTSSHLSPPPYSPVRRGGSAAPSSCAS